MTTYITSATSVDFYVNPRLHIVIAYSFYDVGLAAYLMGITKPEQIAKHPLRGMLFENMVVVEVMKHLLNRGIRPNLMFYRDSNGNEVDLVLSRSHEYIPIEIKSAQTVTGSLLKGLDSFRKTIDSATDPVLVYGGEDTRMQNDTRIVNLSSLNDTLAQLFPG